MRWRGGPVWCHAIARRHPERRVNEKELLDEWVAQTTLTRSGFVTELLVLELE